VFLKKSEKRIWVTRRWVSRKMRKTSPGVSHRRAPCRNRCCFLQSMSQGDQGRRSLGSILSLLKDGKKRKPTIKVKTGFQKIPMILTRISQQCRSSTWVSRSWLNRLGLRIV
jgi:hypothetical protein